MEDLDRERLERIELALAELRGLLLGFRQLLDEYRPLLERAQRRADRWSLKP